MVRQWEKLFVAKDRGSLPVFHVYGRLDHRGDGVV